jgi:hypothetical protein
MGKPLSQDIGHSSNHRSPSFAPADDEHPPELVQSVGPGIGWTVAHDREAVIRQLQMSPHGSTWLHCLQRSPHDLPRLITAPGVTPGGEIGDTHHASTATLEDNGLAINGR